jgi:hypothetical protein
MLPIHFESCVALRAPADAVFTYLDDPNHLSGHMRQSSWMMAGSRMAIELDAAKGRAVGSTIRLSGREWFHLRKEVVTERLSVAKGPGNHRKSLVLVGMMGFDCHNAICRDFAFSRLCVSDVAPRWLGQPATSMRWH